MTFEELKRRSGLQERPKIKPRAQTAAKTPEQKQEVRRVAREVIAQHYAVLSALKDR